MGGDDAIIVNKAGAEGGAFRRKETPGCVAKRSAASGGAAERVCVLLIEDDASINEIVGDHLERCGYACVRAFSGTEAQLLLEREHFDLVVTDLMLPGLAGESLVALIRASDATMPIIVVSARTAPADKIDLLKLGADDYLTKPFDLEELTARIGVQLRHRQARAQARKAGEAAAAPTGEGASGAAEGGRLLRVGRWQVDRAARTLEVDGQDVALTRTEFNILELLASHPKRVFTKQELFELVWGEPYATEDSTVNVHVSNLRHKLRPSGTDAYIQTVWGLGFKLAL